MTDMLEVQGQGFRSLVAAHLVTKRAFVSFLQAAGQPVPAPLAHSGAPANAVTWASQVEAAEYCDWLGKQEGRQYRLPSVAELVAFHFEAEQKGLEAGAWPADAARETMDCVAHDTCFCEWTCETEEVPIYGTDRVRVLGSIFYPPWLREGNNVVHMQAHMLASEGYSWISFRVAQDA